MSIDETGAVMEDLTLLWASRRRVNWLFGVGFVGFMTTSPFPDTGTGTSRTVITSGRRVHKSVLLSFQLSSSGLLHKLIKGAEER